MMLIILVGGSSFLILKKEAQPRIPVTNIKIFVPFYGASPEEVEEGILLKLEGVLKDVEGIETLNTFATENGGTADIKVATNDGYRVETVMDRVEQAVSTISRFPLEAEKPIITPASWQDATSWNMVLPKNASKVMCERCDPSINSAAIGTSIRLNLASMEFLICNLRVPLAS